MNYCQTKRRAFVCVYSSLSVWFSVCAFSISWQRLPGTGGCCVGLEVGRGSMVGL